MNMHRFWPSLLAASLLATTGVAATPPEAGPRVSAPSRLQVTWLGHAAFEIVSQGGTRLLIDPWLTRNDRAPAAWKELARYAKQRPAAILVTHAHADHAEDVPALAKATGALVVGTGEHLRAMKIPEAQQHTVNVGGSFPLGDVVVHAVPAMHSNEPGGRPLGYVVTFADGRSLYHSGDTWLFGDMSLIHELYHPDILLLATGGGRWGLDPKTAALAVRRYFQPSVIIPMHFGTFAPLAEEAEVRAAFGSDPRVRFLTPGEPILF